MRPKNFLFKYIEKFVLGIAVGYFIYTVFYTSMILKRKTHKVNTKLQSLSDVIERKLKMSEPPAISTKLKEAMQLELRFATPPKANFLQQFKIFRKPAKGESISDITMEDLLKKAELQAYPHLKVDVPGDREFIFKGGTPELALIQVRRLYKDVWWTKSFIVEKGKTIGEKKTIRGETIDFDTRCKLIEIVPFAQKPLMMKRASVLRDKENNFLGTSLTEEAEMISTSKIVFEYKKGKSYDLWIGEFVNLGTETVIVHPLTNTSLTH